jgi:protein TonB
LVGVDGSPLKIEVDKSSRHRVLDQEAVRAARSWKFNPEIRDGRPIEGWVSVPINFTLN